MVNCFYITKDVREKMVMTEEIGDDTRVAVVSDCDFIWWGMWDLLFPNTKFPKDVFEQIFCCNIAADLTEVVKYLTDIHRYKVTR